MTLNELKAIIDRVLEVSPHKADSAVVVRTNDPSIGPCAAVNVKQAYPGFDWDNNRFIIYVDEPIVRKQT